MLKMKNTNWYLILRHNQWHMLITLCYMSTLHSSSDAIHMTARMISPAECKQRFLYNLHAYLLHPVELSICNSSDKTYLISGNSIEELALVPPHIITPNIIFKYDFFEKLTSYSYAIGSSLATFAGLSYAPKFLEKTKYITTICSLIGFLYKAFQFHFKRSHMFKDVHHRINDDALCETIMVIHPYECTTKIMYLNTHSYAAPPEQEHTFFYIFTTTLYNIQDSTDTCSIQLEVPKIILDNTPQASNTPPHHIN